MDYLDRASELELKHTQMALSNHFKANQTKFVVSAIHCTECGGVIPEARRIASQGCQYCVVCQSQKEMRIV